MYDLARFTLRDMAHCSAALRKLGDGAGSMQQVAGRIVSHLYDHLRDTQSGEPTCVLVRLFKTHEFGDLPVDLQHFAGGVLAGASTSPDMKCLVLLASAGSKPEWNDVRASVAHRAIPLASVEAVRRFPMISQLIQQFGVELSAVLRPDPSLLLDLEPKTYNVFHVAQAVGSPYVPDQERFVLPCSVRSVLGFGGLLYTGDLFAVVLFSKAPVQRETADLFRPLALSVKVALLPFADRAVFR
jgi:hypothetical protein